MEHILDLEAQEVELFSIFKKIQESNTILFLGAGASVGEKRYLSKEIIEYYEPFLKKKNSETNITKFIDYLSADEDFSRNDFDLEVVKLLQKLKITEAHRIMASIPWREIITTNYDLLVERAYDAINNTHQHSYDLRPIKKFNQYNGICSKTEVKYIKLNGCIQDIGQYPLAFSTDDFNKLNKFYKLVLNDLRNLSPEINFLSIGYSFSDQFGKEFLEKFDLYNFRDKKWLINVDPFPNESTLSYYKSKKICIIKSSFQEFFVKFSEWENNTSHLTVKKKGLNISDSRGYRISIPPKLLLNLQGTVKQLNQDTKDKNVKEIDFYKGEEPTFTLITRGVDVIKESYIRSNVETILETLKIKNPTYIPIFFITGDFGIGKSTFTLRLIYELEKIDSLDLIAFEIEEFNMLKRELIIDLILHTKSKNIILYCDEVEIESYFKAFIELHRELSVEQFQDCNVFFIVPIRENILEKYKFSKTIHNSIELKLKGTLQSEEIDDLLEKLKKNNLIEFRDAREKKKLHDKIVQEYQSDSFISLMSIITSGKHENDLVSCYEQLSPELKNAFLYTALLHQHHLLMPANWLKHITSMSWEEFLNKVVKVEGKGILLQESINSYGTQPDLFFRTKHPLIAKKLIERIIPNKDKQFSLYKKMLGAIEVGQTNSYLVNNLLKSFTKNNEFTDSQLNTLYDAAYQNLADDPYFLLNYTINLQNRNNVTFLQKSIDLIIYAESLLEKRNHKFIHRRAVINFDLAKLTFKTETHLHNTLKYTKEAKELFVLKQLLDPFTSYSYVDFIKLIIWELQNIQFDKEDEMQRQILIEELFDIANRAVNEGIDKINALYTTYSQYKREFSNNLEYKEHLEELYQQLNLRPYACILLANYYQSQNDSMSFEDIITEIEHYQDNLEVVNFLHKYYGNHLHDPNFRIKLLSISTENPHLEKVNPLRYFYFLFVAETYNYQFSLGKNYLSKIQNFYHHFNPEYRNLWLNSDGSVKIFDAIIIKNAGERFKAIKIPSIQLTARLIRGDYDKYPVGSNVTVSLHFYLYGLMAEIMNELDNDDDI